MLWNLIILIIIIIVIIIIIIVLDVNRFFALNNSNLNILNRKYKSKPKVKCEHRVVISLTTIPDRINLLKSTIASLLTQSVKVDEIRINISRDKKYIIPKWLKSLSNIKFHYVDKDLGPATKLLPTIKTEDADTRIIVVDDDVIYGIDLVKKLIKEFELRNGKEVITTAGTKFGDFSWRRIIRFGQSGYVDIVHGHAGFVVCGYMFDHRLFNYSIGPKEAFYVDDNWISGWLRVNKVKIYALGVGFRNTPLPNHQSGTIDALCRTHNKGGQNEHIVNKWFKTNYSC